MGVSWYRQNLHERVYTRKYWLDRYRNLDMYAYMPGTSGVHNWNMVSVSVVYSTLPQILVR